jgi:hypothetical protein
MTGVLPFLIVGLLLIVLLIFSRLRARSADHAGLESFENDKSPAILPEGFFPQELAARLFGPEDREFIAKQGCARLMRLFRQQRTELALCWLRGVRANASRLMDIHNRAAGKNSGLQPLVELRIFIEYFAIQAVCQILALAIWVRGPVDLSHMIRYVQDLSNRLYAGIRELFPAELAPQNDGGQIHLKDGRTGS